MACQKTGFFADDLYSYGYANSPGCISPLETGEKLYTIRWIPGKALHEYLTVSSDERFTYGRIVETLERDAHPPLFYFILHSICSMTPDKFSVWSAFIINALGLTLLQMYLYRLCLFIGNNRFIALLILIFFGFSSATINMMVLLRMYILATGFTVAFSYYALKYLYDIYSDKIIDENLLLSFVFLYLSSMTVYLSVLFAFLLTLIICIMLLIRKKIKRMFCFGFCMLFSIGVMCLSFPVVFTQLLGDKVAIKGADLFPYMLQIRTSIYVISNGLFGINTPIYPTMIPFYTVTSLIGLGILYAIIHFVFRNDTWFMDFIKKLRTSVVFLFQKSLKYIRPLLPFVIISITFVLLFSKELKIYYYKELAMRYYYIITPFIAMIILLLLLKLIRPTFARFGIIAILTVTSLIFGSKCYLQQQLESAKIEPITRGCDVIVIETDPPTFMYHIMDLMGCKSFLFATTTDVFDGNVDDSLLEKAKESDNILLMVDQTAANENSMTSKTYKYDGTEAITSKAENDVVNHFQSIPGFEHTEHVGTYYGSYIYRLK
ncbi:MAG: hypothetical protein K6F86_06035 [Lachnospiraceae bacterium]|nr:hypothetical protein [Lachnospiraceae bacterium]